MNSSTVFQSAAGKNIITYASNGLGVHYLRLYGVLEVREPYSYIRNQATESFVSVSSLLDNQFPDYHLGPPE